MDEIKDIVQSVFEQISSKTIFIGREKILSVWQATLEEKTLRHTAIQGIKEEKLLVNVDSPAMLFYLNLKKNKILKKLQQDIPDIKSIYFKIGEIS